MRSIPALFLSLATLILPAVTQAQVSIVFDYSLDSNGFFGGANIGRRAYLDSAATALQSRLADTLAAITPGGQNTWSNIFSNPSTGLSQTGGNISIPANTLLIYVGSSTTLPSSTLGVGGFGGFTATGTGTWFDTIVGRGEAGIVRTQPNTTWTDHAPWGGSISFNHNAAWNFDPGIQVFSDNDFYSVALHELGHVLGIGTAPSWNNLISGGNFTGSVSMSLNGGPVPVTGDNGHWGSGVTSTLPGTATPQEVAMDPDLTIGTRKFFTNLDFGGLDDIGWDVVPVPEPEAYAFVVGLGLLGFALYRRRAVRPS